MGIWSRVTGRTTQVFWTKPSRKVVKNPIQSIPGKDHPPPAMKSVCLVLILAVTVSLGNALRCYVCNSHVDEDCNKYDDDGSFAGATIEKCADDEKYCRKIYQMIRDEESVIRTCGKEEDTGTVLVTPPFWKSTTPRSAHARRIFA